MRGYVIDHYDHPSKLQLRQDAPEPKPQPEDVVVEVYSAALNFFDVRLSRNLRDPYRVTNILSSDPASAGEVPAPTAFSGEDARTRESIGRIHMHSQYVLGSEFAGRIAKDSPIPKGCPFKPGDRVFGSGQGAYGDRVATTWKMLVPLPDSMTYEQGAGEFFFLATLLRPRIGPVAYCPLRTFRDLADQLRSARRTRGAQSG